MDDRGSVRRKGRDMVQEWGPSEPPQWVKAELDGGEKISRHFRVWGIHRPYKLPERKAEER